MNLLNVTPQLNRDTYKWFLRTNPANLPPAKTFFDDEGRRGQNVHSYLRGIYKQRQRSGEFYYRPCCKIESFSRGENPILFENVEKGRNTQIEEAMMAENIKSPSWTEIGHDQENDRSRGSAVTDSAMVVATKSS
jgi:glucose-1-phosphate adenylyltransferase